MPRSWHDRYEVNRIEDEETKDFYRKIVADKKPYFMRYIYPDLMRKYNTYIKNTDRSSLREFQMTVKDLMDIPYSKLSERQIDFLRYYKYRMPVGTNDCVMNKICKRFEDAFDGFVSKTNLASEFDYHFMRGSAEYTPKQFALVKKFYEEYDRRVRNYKAFIHLEKVDSWEIKETLETIGDEFIRKCDEVCPNRATLCNIVLDICYLKNTSKSFAWDMCGTEIIQNLLLKNNCIISYPAKDDAGDIVFCGERFSLITTRIEVDE